MYGIAYVRRNSYVILSACIVFKSVLHLVKSKIFIKHGFVYRYKYNTYVTRMPR